jgi:hypothetical protein
MPAGRKLTFNPERAAQIVERLKAGCTRRAAAESVGVTYECLRLWLEASDRGREEFVGFLASVTRAEAEAEARMTACVVKAALDDWRAAESWLKRRRREDWGDGIAVRYERMTNEQLASYIAGSPLAVASGDVDSRGDSEAQGRPDRPARD